MAESANVVIRVKNSNLTPCTLFSYTDSEHGDFPTYYQACSRSFLSTRLAAVRHESTTLSCVIGRRKTLTDEITGTKQHPRVALRSGSRESPTK